MEFDDIIEKVKQSLTHNIKINLPKIDKEMIEEIKPKNDYPIGHPKFWQDISIEALVEGDKDYSQWQDRDAMWLSRKR